MVGGGLKTLAFNNWMEVNGTRTTFFEGFLFVFIKKIVSFIIVTIPGNITLDTSRVSRAKLPDIPSISGIPGL